MIKCTDSEWKTTKSWIIYKEKLFGFTSSQLTSEDLGVGGAQMIPRLTLPVSTHLYAPNWHFPLSGFYKTFSFYFPILGYPSVHYSAWPRFTYGLHFPAFSCPPPPRFVLLLSIPFRLRFISIHKSYLAAPKSRDITHKPSLHLTSSPLHYGCSTAFRES